MRLPISATTRPLQLARPLVAAAAALALATAAASARANVAFPAPGEMSVAGLPAQLRGGHTLTLRELMPLAIFDSELELQCQTQSGWRTLTMAPPRPKVVWLHWRVPLALAGTQLVVRFVLENGGRLLALSPSYAMTVTR
jgi:hypothetical protein